MKSRFTLDKNSKIWLYGAATTGVLTEAYLTKFGYTTIGFIDKRADEIRSLCNKKVIGITQIENELDSDDTVVIVAIKNVFDHQKVASLLLEKGFHNLIFFPFRCLDGKGTPEEKQLYEISNIINKRRPLNNCSLPRTFDVSSIEIVDQAFIKQIGTRIIAYIPVNLIFTDRELKSKSYILNSISPDNTIEDKNILTLFSHINFFRYLLGESEGDIQEYLKFCEDAARRLNKFEITDRWRENVIKNRIEIFENMNKNYMLNFDFFIDNAPDVLWNDKGYFNLRSGKHRAAFLVAKKNFCLPVNIEKTDYEKLFQQDKIIEIRHLIETKKIQDLNVPIEHPCFIGLLCNNRTFWFNTLFKICLTVLKERKTPLSESSMLIDIKDMSFLARFFAKMDIQVSKTQRSIIDIDFENAINGLLYTDIPIISDINKYHKTYTWMLSDQMQNNNFVADNCIYFTSHILSAEKYYLITSGINNGIDTYIYLQLKG